MRDNYSDYYNYNTSNARYMLGICEDKFTQTREVIEKRKRIPVHVTKSSQTCIDLQQVSGLCICAESLTDCIALPTILNHLSAHCGTEQLHVQ